MPVSKKRKKSGKPVKRAAATPPEAGHEGAEAKPAHPPSRAGKPSNPFVGQHQMPRGAQRGR